MTASTFTYSLRPAGTRDAFDASMPHGATQAGVNGYVTLARRYVR